MCCFLPTSWYLFHILTRPGICIDHSPARCQVTAWTLGQCKSAYWHCDFGRSASVCNGPGSDSLTDVKSPTWCGYYSSHLQREKAFRTECKGFLDLFHLNIRKWKGDRNSHLIPQCNNTWPEMKLAQTKHWLNYKALQLVQLLLHEDNLCETVPVKRSLQPRTSTQSVQLDRHSRLGIWVFSIF